MKLATIVLLGILLLGSLASMQAANPAGASQIVLAFTGGSAYTSDTTGICIWYPLLVGDLNMEYLFQFVDGAPAVDKEHAYLIWVSDFESLPQTPFLLPPSSKGLLTLQLVPAGTATIYFTDVPRLRNWTDLTKRTTWGTPVATFDRKAGIFQSTDGGMSGALPISAQLTSSKPFKVNGVTFDFKDLIPHGMTCFETGFSGTTSKKDKKSNDDGGDDEAGTCIAIGPGQ
ncbi:MAG: hypothetical protein ABSG26_15595 [Bryobacteraceae bacterium]|jgi:hypothetical protein